jgi:O-antigen ligase
VSLWDDIKVSEQDGINLKQRYIEWQAELNLLEERTITGTAAGCINDYRSNFYYRLPKLNTLNAFDQNGWLATGAETGILGLVCFCWIILRHLKLAYLQVTTTDRSESVTAYRYNVANFVGLVVVCVANLFSSVHYNGVLIIFVLLLVLISKSDVLFKKNAKCESELLPKQP